MIPGLRFHLGWSPLSWSSALSSWPGLLVFGSGSRATVNGFGLRVLVLGSRLRGSVTPPAHGYLPCALGNAVSLWPRAPACRRQSHQEPRPPATEPMHPSPPATRSRPSQRLNTPLSLKLQAPDPSLTFHHRQRIRLYRTVQQVPLGAGRGIQLGLQLATAQHLPRGLGHRAVRRGVLSIVQGTGLWQQLAVGHHHHHMQVFA